MAETRVLFNGECPICSREVGAYARDAERSEASISFEPLQDSDLAEWGLDADSAAREFHLMRDGKILKGIDAFVVLWRELPRFRWLAWLVSRPGILQLARLVYRFVLAPGLYALHRRRQARA